MSFTRWHSLAQAITLETRNMFNNRLPVWYLMLLTRAWNVSWVEFATSITKAVLFNIHLPETKEKVNFRTLR